MNDSASVPATAAAPPAAEEIRFSRRRAILVWSLVGIATLLLFISSLTIWVKRQVISTDGYVNTTSQMLQNDEIRSTVSTYMVETLYDNVDVTALIQQRLPPNTQGLAPVAAAGLRQLALRTTNELLASARFQTLWEETNRRAHQRLMDILNGKKTGRFETANGDVVLDLQPLIERIANSGALGTKLAAQLPADSGQVTILRSDQLKSAQDGVKVLKALTVFLVFASLGLYAIAIGLARGRRRRILRGAAASFILVGLLLLALRSVLQDAIVSAVVKTDSAKPAANAAWSIATSMLRDIAVALIIYGIVGLVGAILAGPTRPAVAARRWLAPNFRDRAAVVWGAVAVLYLLLIWWGPTPALHRWWGILLLAGLLAIGLAALQRQTLREHAVLEPAPRPEPS